MPHQMGVSLLLSVFVILLLYSCTFFCDQQADKRRPRLHLMVRVDSDTKKMRHFKRHTNYQLGANNQVLFILHAHIYAQHAHVYVYDHQLAVLQLREREQSGGKQSVDIVGLSLSLPTSLNSPLDI